MRALLLAGVVSAVCFLTCGALVAARPQESATAAPAATPTRSVADAAAYLSRVSGVLVLADDTVRDERVPMPDPKAQITPGTVEAYIDALAKSLPAGVVWARLYLPPPPAGRRWTGDVVAAYARAQAELYGAAAGAGGPDGTVEILSQHLPRERAAPVVAALDLRPVYLLTRHSGPATFAGTWKTTFGEMRLTQTGARVRGTYTYQDGVITGVARGRVLRLLWEERGNGGHGAAYFTLTEDGKSFSGTYNNGEDYPVDGSGSAWIGTRTDW